MRKGSDLGKQKLKLLVSICKLRAENILAGCKYQRRSLWKDMFLKMQNRKGKETVSHMERMELNGQLRLVRG